MSKKQHQPSQPNTVGKDIPGALKGNRDNEGVISGNYVGRPGNAKPDYNPHTPNPKPVADWTKGSLKKSREEAKERKEAAQKK
uniref:Uncharacterized protein n=1 Tax=Panagrolaimus davidi TaxID=227884 RepID=A0A914PVR6_9BILA